jgi:N-acetylglucosaminyldiphosphoundecaprenol N-acetyl-beta-D-mannosaminyltransferase
MNDPTRNRQNAAPDTSHESRITSGSVLGIRVDDVTYEEVLAHIEGWIASASRAERRTAPAAAEVHQVATVNVEFIMRARGDTAFRRVLADASLCVPDGIGVLWAARRRGTPLRQRVAGVDLVERIAARGAEKGWRIYFLGAAPGVAERAAAVLSARYPGLKVAGCYAGSPRLEEEHEIVDRVRATDPDLLFVAYGAPQQDLWISRNQARTGVPVAVGVGGSFDFITGVARRAPEWVQRIGLEWLHRLAREPWRIRRQTAIPHFVALVLLNRE